ncbi:unnamed protein product [Thelazia callipaeda]|uniref:Integrase n=1 Tax=Thelazia callipaeda TaxID=103827 RepID=A0A0N5D851_THECL|nr:unnamed protein product [Thelazia callipaeda]
MAVSRKIRAKEISPPSYMKRMEGAHDEQLLRNYWLKEVNTRMRKHEYPLRSSPYLSFWPEP